MKNYTKNVCMLRQMSIFHLPITVNCTVHLYYSAVGALLTYMMFYGLIRSIVWLQNRTESQLSSSSSTNRHSGLSAAALAVVGGHRGDGMHDLLQLGRLRHDRVKVPREEHTFLDWAMNVLQVHAKKKSILEVSYQYFNC